MNTESARLLAGVQQWFSDDNQVAHYAGEVAQGPTLAEQWLLGQLPNEGRLLDLGCGAGRLSWPLAQRGLAVVGVDVSRPLLQAAMQRKSGTYAVPFFIQVDPLAMPFTDGVFDAVLACKVYCYLPGGRARRQYLTELWRLLRPGGRLLLSQHVVPARWFGSYRDDTHRQAAATFRQLEPGDTFAAPDGSGYVHWFTPAQLRQELDGSPFRVIVWRDDHELGGEGYMQLAVLERSDG